MKKTNYLIMFVVGLVFLVLLVLTNKQNLHIDAEQQLISREIFGNYLSGSVAQKTGHYDAAIESFEKALVKDPKNDLIISRLYGLYLYQGRYEEAIDHANREIEIQKINPPNWSEASAIPHILVAVDEFKNGNIKDIPELLLPFINPELPDKNHLDGVVLPIILAWAYAVDDKFEEAFKVIDGITSSYMLSIFSYNRALINDLANNKLDKLDGLPENLKSKDKALYFIGRMFGEIGGFSLKSAQLIEATVYLRIAKYIDIDNYEYTKLLGVILETQGNYDEAIELYDSVSEDSKNYDDATISKAIALSRSKNNKKAIELLSQVSPEEKGLKYKAEFTIGSIHLSENDYNKAIEELEEAVKNIEKPTRENWAIYFNLGVAYDKIDNWRKAEENLKKSVELFPQNPETLNYLAYSWLVRNKNIKQARKMLEAAVIGSGGSAHILDSYGWALYKLGYYDQALPFLEQAASSIPYNSVINDHLADLYWKLGRKREAKYLWQRALDNYNKETELEVSKQEIRSKIEKGL